MYHCAMVSKDYANTQVKSNSKSRSYDFAVAESLTIINDLYCIIVRNVNISARSTSKLSKMTCSLSNRCFIKIRKINVRLSPVRFNQILCRLLNK